LGRFDVASFLSMLGRGAGELPGQLNLAQELIEALPVPIFFKARDGRYLGVNRAWEDFFGIRREEFLGKTVHELYPQSPGVAERHFAMDLELWNNPGSQRYEIPVTVRGGRVRHTIYCKATFTGADGELAGLIGTILDITDRKQAEQRETIEHAATRLIAEADTLSDAIRGIINVMCEQLGWVCGAHWSIQPDGKTLKRAETWAIADPAIGAFLDTTRGMVYAPSQSGLVRRVLGTGTAVWIPDVAKDKDFLRASAAAAAGLHGAFALPILIGSEVRGVIEFYSRDVSQLDDWLLQLGVSVGNQIGQLMARRQAEAGLREAHEELSRRAQDLVRSNAELQQFAYVASHDLQEPLRMISSYTQLLMRRYGKLFDADAKEFMDFIVDGAARMKQLIEDLLAYSRVGTRGRGLAPTGAQGALDQALANLRASIEATGATVTYDALPTVHADESQLVQLFQNLVGNALKFKGAEAPRIHVAARDEGAEVVLSVRDNGIGIDPQYFERIFVIFQRLHSKAEYDGTGIGLAICKKIVDRHGGRIWVESQPGRGSTFYCTLPGVLEVPPAEAGTVGEAVSR
jgi:PAS domain S-box-containing protein